MFEAFGRLDAGRAKNAMVVACMLCAIVVVWKNVKLRLPIICIGTNILSGDLSAYQLWSIDLWCWISDVLAKALLLMVMYVLRLRVFEIYFQLKKLSNSLAMQHHWWKSDIAKSQDTE